MNGKELIRILEEQSPRSYALEWDNVGLLAGSADKEVNKVYIALDATDEAVEESVKMGADLLLTNFDVMGMADLSAAMLGLEEPKVLDVTYSLDGKEEGIGRVGRLMEPMAPGELAEFVKAAFSLSSVRIYGDPGKRLSVAAISPGSGKSEIENAIRQGADVLITGDIDHHDGMDAAARGLCVLDAGHYGLEHIFVPYMEGYLKQRCAGVEIKAQELSFPYWEA